MTTTHWKVVEGNTILSIKTDEGDEIFGIKKGSYDGNERGLFDQIVCEHNTHAAIVEALRRLIPCVHALGSKEHSEAVFQAQAALTLAKGGSDHDTYSE